MLLNFPIPPFPNFLKIDFSDIPALIGTLIFGPIAGVLIELIKNILDYFMTGSETGVPVGHFANFISGLMFILPTYYIYNKIKDEKWDDFGINRWDQLNGRHDECAKLFCSITSIYVFLEYASYERARNTSIYCSGSSTV